MKTECHYSQEYCSEIEKTFKERFGYRPPEGDFDLHTFSNGWAFGCRSLVSSLIDELVSLIVFGDTSEVDDNLSGNRCNDFDNQNAEERYRIRIAASVLDFLNKKHAEIEKEIKSDPSCLETVYRQ